MNLFGKFVIFPTTLFWAGSFLPFTAQAAEVCTGSSIYAVVVHGGAGSWNLPHDDRTRFVAAIRDILADTKTRLQNGAKAVDIVEAAVTRMEDSGLFNAGKGSIANSAGIHELDASIMDGSGLRAGAVATVKSVKNPVAAARLVMDRTPHVLLVDQGADAFARAQGLPPVGSSYFVRARTEMTKKFGTVGAVALDRCGNVAAATSTGGYPGKMPGRVGDSPIIGAGTYANNATAALSGTGHGEFFMRHAATHDVSALMAYAGLSLDAAMDRVIKGTLSGVGGEGGMIGVDARGQVAVSYNTPGMLHGYVTDRADAVIDF